MSKKPLKASLAIAAIVLIVASTAAFVRWRNRQIKRLESHSTVVETAQGPVEYAVIGQGPAVLVLHGTLGGYDQLRPLADMLDTESYTLIFVSRPGYLRTPLSTGATYEEQAHAYAALLDKLDVDRAAVIAASGGGPSALQFALLHPDRCWGMVMLSANTDARAGRAQVDERRNPPARQPPRMVMDLIFSDLSSWVLAGAARLLPRRFLAVMLEPVDVEAVLSDPAKRRLYDEWIDSLALLSRRRAGALNDGAQFLGFTGHPLEEIAVPMLILHGTSDSAVRIAEPRYLYALVPYSEYVEIEGGTHFMLLSHHDILAPLFADFLAAHAPLAATVQDRSESHPAAP